MAAHLKTALEQVQQEVKLKKVYWAGLQAALNISCWTEDLSLDDYTRLHNIVRDQDVAELDAFIKTVYPTVTDEWERLGQPRCREDWLRKKYFPEEG